MPPTNQKSLVIHRVPLVAFEKATSCPTSLYYVPGGDPLIGFAAIEQAENDDNIPRINHDFKVALGMRQSRPPSGDGYPCADGETRTALPLTADFLRACLSRASEALKQHGVADTAHLIVAEPVSVHSEEKGDWLANFRSNWRVLLEKRRYENVDNVYFGEIEFLPEPLAVFNYYRYGYRHPELSGKEKYCVLVLDVGGGTSDCSVVETTKDGEVSQTGKMSKPLGASSAAIGGYVVNHFLASRLMANFAGAEENRRRVTRTLRRCLQIVQGRENHSILSGDEVPFFENYQWVIHYVEGAKRNLSDSINSDPRGWLHDVPPASEEWVDLPNDPYSAESGWTSQPLSTSTFREVFAKDIWSPFLKPLIRTTITNATPALDGKPINRVILSGGTANIGWIGAWLSQEIDELKGASLVDIKEDYQEVVAKGLAIECARRFFSPEHTSDFDMVTYNPLSVALGFGGEDPRPLPMKPFGEIKLPDLHEVHGALIEAATDMRAFDGKRLQWKVATKVGAPRKIEYYFHAGPATALQESPSAVESRLNYEQWEIISTGNKFDQHPKIELEIRADGTVTPVFILRDGKHAEPGDRIRGKSFYLDMTSARTEVKTATKAYLGLDFGSSNTALAFVSASSISQYQKDAQDPSWLELSDLESFLPTPVAAPLALYITESGDPLRRTKRARQTIETGLALLLGALYADEEKRSLSSSHAGKHGPMKNFRIAKVSAGPVWLQVRTYVSTLGLNATFTKSLGALTAGPVFDAIDRAVTNVAETKHDKADEQTIDWNRPLMSLGNLARQVFEKVQFGFFLESRLRGGKVHAKFRKLHGQGVGSAPITVILAKTPEDGQAYILDTEALRAIPLFPWILLQNAEDSERRQFLFFDGPEGRDGKAFSYKCPGEPMTVTLRLGEDEGLGIYAAIAAKLTEGSFPAETIEVLELPETSS